MIRRICAVLILLTLCLPMLCAAADWPQFRGPNRDGKSPETGLLKEWPAGGPTLLWSYEGLGDGYSTVIVADGFVYANGVAPGDKHGTLFAFDLEGNLKWQKSYGPEWAGRKPGSHCPPTFDSGRLYFMSGMCVISCLDAKTGDIIWSIDTIEKFGAVNLKWGAAEAPLIFGEKVLCTPGGRDATMVALDKMTGKTIWTTKGLSELSAYCSPQLIEWGNKRVVLTMAAKSVVFIDLENGKTLLQIPHTCKYDISAVRPVFKEGLLYVTNGYGYRGILYQIAPGLGSDEKKWIEKELDCHHGGVILLNGNL
ncbi:MAG: outer membrane protein assembly factor BamB family protein, partial [Planctomycetota bacterium]